MKSSAQLEQETEASRERVNATLEELRARATPGQLVDQLVDYARGSDGGAFYGNLRRQVVNNPLPVILLGASLAWIAFAQARPAANPDRTRLPRRDERRADRAMDNVHETGARFRDAAQSASEAATDAVDSSRDAAATVAQSTRNAVDAASQTASDTLQNIRERASDTYDRALGSTRRAAASVGDAMTDARQTAGDMSRGFVALCKEQPILMAGAGVALGATLGALLPTSDAENRVMGEASDDVKVRARRLGDRVKEGAQTVYDEAKGAAANAVQPDTTSAPVAAEFGHS
ncbi:MAG TPA: DUF3618 domain-containing protein [Casimicrobiaceae bacterium]|jgi:ElaB/YqjD/DUF883 family membrane-anchored ribosome-binding protein